MPKAQNQAVTANTSSSAHVTATNPLLYQRLVESVTDYAIYMISVDGHVSSWNQGAQRFKGYTAEEIIGKHFSCFYPAEARARNKPQRALRIARTEGRFEDRDWRVRKNGERFRAHVVIDPIKDECGELIGFAKITRDITESWEKEQALIESERRFRMLVSSVTDYAIYMLDLGGHINSWNAGAQRFKNRTEEEVLGKHFSMFYTPEDRRNEKPQRALRIALEHGRFEDTGWRVRKGGEAFWAHVIIDLIRDEQGEPVGFAKITRDITERREAELRLKNLARNNQELEQFVQIASHDLREPLRTVLAFSDLLEYEEGDKLSQDGKTYLSNISSATRRMRGLLDSLLSLSRVTTHGDAFEACDLNAVIDEVKQD
ncbi:MAG: PAS domain S-box protein, partial [Salinisphaeraceae bacterium]|nr:PAS domain S-box protein [Salinisphaeraceae bacterium]